MIIDTHVHTQECSMCSVMNMKQLKQVMKEKETNITCVTDHSLIGCACHMNRDHDITVIVGAEISFSFGDTLIFSTDREYVKSLTFDHDRKAMFEERVVYDDIEVRDDTAIIWAHPYLEVIDKGTELEYIVEKIDALELYNGNMLRGMMEGSNRKDRIKELEEIADKYDLACTGGSDAHAVEEYMRCWTEFEDSIENLEQFIQAIKSKKVKPDCLEELKWLTKL